MWGSTSACRIQTVNLPHYSESPEKLTHPLALNCHRCWRQSTIALFVSNNVNAHGSEIHMLTRCQLQWGRRQEDKDKVVNIQGGILGSGEWVYCSVDVWESLTVLLVVSGGTAAMLQIWEYHEKLFIFSCVSHSLFYGGFISPITDTVNAVKEFHWHYVWSGNMNWNPAISSFWILLLLSSAFLPRASETWLHPKTVNLFTVGVMAAT